MVRKIQAKLVLKLRARGLSARAIATAHGISRNSIAEVFDAVDRAFLDWDRIMKTADGSYTTAIPPKPSLTPSLKLSWPPT